MLDVIGAGVIGLSALWVGVMLAETWRRERHDRLCRRAELALLREELEAARERRKAARKSTAPWAGFRKFVVKRKVMEGEDQCSFYLVPHDRKRLPTFLPGQYLTFQLTIPGQSKPVIRCYSLSDRPDPEFYRVTIKRLGPPPGASGVPAGLGSSYFHEQVNEGDILDVKAPAGQFHLEPAGRGGIVLIGGGIGVTPMISILRTLAAEQTTREVWLFYGIRNRAEHIMREVLHTTAQENPSVRLVICYSQPSGDEAREHDYHVQGRVSLDLLKARLPSNNYDFYLCGPGAMMESLTLGLKDWGVPEAKVHFETFGPSSVRRVGATQPPMAMAAAGCSVNFKRSGRLVPWGSKDNNLLELAERHGITIASGCRAGNCGTCAVAIQDGDVSYVQPPGSPPDPGLCLTCVAKPRGDLVLDA